jgi:hypothetical protein
MNKNEKTYIVISGSVTKSIIKDVFTFLMFAGLLYFNHQFLSGSTLIDVLFIIMVLFFLAAKRGKNYLEGTREEIIDYLERENDN